MGKINYHVIKKLASDVEGATIKDLIALAPQNDPFYVGTTGDVEKAQWFAAIWQQFGYTRGVHLRRVHYQLVSQSPPINKPNGKPYANTERDWDFLGMASKAARYMGTVSPGAFVDRRNPDPHIFAHYWDDQTPDYELNSNGHGLQVSLPEFPTMPDFQVSGYDEGNLQPVHLEIWCEKSTMNDVLLPVCQEYEINLVTGAGEMSITAALQVVHRIKRANRPACILYISDFDPAGYGMPVGVSRKLEFFLSNQDLDLDIQLEPIALTGEQVAAYDLPRTPIKKSELRRASFVEAHGQGAVELDALEAVHPGLLAEIVTQAIRRYHDPEIYARAQDQRRDLEHALEQARTETLLSFSDEIGVLQETFQQAVSEFEQSVKAVQDRLGELYPQIIKALGAIDIDTDDFPLPDPQEPDEFESPLYDSRRDYFDQLRKYKTYQSGERE